MSNQDLSAKTAPVAPVEMVRGVPDSIDIAPPPLARNSFSSVTDVAIRNEELFRRLLKDTMEVAAFAQVISALRNSVEALRGREWSTELTTALTNAAIVLEESSHLLPLFLKRELRPSEAGRQAADLLVGKHLDRFDRAADSLQGVISYVPGSEIEKEIRMVAELSGALHERFTQVNPIEAPGVEDHAVDVAISTLTNLRRFALDFAARLERVLDQVTESEPRAETLQRCKEIVKNLEAAHRSSHFATFSEVADTLGVRTGDGTGPSPFKGPDVSLGIMAEELAQAHRMIESERSMPSPIRSEFHAILQTLDARLKKLIRFHSSKIEDPALLALVAEKTSHPGVGAGTILREGATQRERERPAILDQIAIPHGMKGRLAVGTVHHFTNDGRGAVVELEGSKEWVYLTKGAWCGFEAATSGQKLILSPVPKSASKPAVGDQLVCVVAKDDRGSRVAGWCFRGTAEGVLRYTNKATSTPPIAEPASPQEGR